MKSFSLGIILFCYFLTIEKIKAAEDGCALSEHDKNVICVQAIQVNGFCPTAGPSDDCCKKMADAVQGTNPKCFEEHICSFTKNGKEAYVSSKDSSSNTVYKDCNKGVSVIGKPGGGDKANGSPPPSNSGGNGSHTPANGDNKNKTSGGGSGSQTTPDGNHKNSSGDHGQAPAGGPTGITPASGGDKNKTTSGDSDKKTSGTGDNGDKNPSEGSTDITSAPGGNGGKSGAPPSGEEGGAPAPTTCASA